MWESFQPACRQHRRDGTVRDKTWAARPSGGRRSCTRRPCTKTRLRQSNRFHSVLSRGYNHDPWDVTVIWKKKQEKWKRYDYFTRRSPFKGMPIAQICSNCGNLRRFNTSIQRWRLIHYHVYEERNHWINVEYFQSNKYYYSRNPSKGRHTIRARRHVNCYLQTRARRSFSVRSKTKRNRGVCFACITLKRNSRFYMRTEKEMKRNEAKRNKTQEAK